MREAEASTEVARVPEDVNSGSPKGEDDGKDRTMASHMASPRPYKRDAQKKRLTLLSPPSQVLKFLR